MIRRTGPFALVFGVALALGLSGCAGSSGVSFDSHGQGYCSLSELSDTIWVGLLVTNSSDSGIEVTGVDYGSLNTIEPIDAWIVPNPSGEAGEFGSATEPDWSDWDERVQVSDADLPAQSTSQLVVQLRTMEPEYDVYAKGVVLTLVDGSTVKSDVTIGILGTAGEKNCVV